MSKFTVHGNLLAEVQVTVEAKTEEEALKTARQDAFCNDYGDGESWAAAGVEVFDTPTLTDPEATNWGVEWQHAKCVEVDDDEDEETD